MSLVAPRLPFRLVPCVAVLSPFLLFLFVCFWCVQDPLVVARLLVVGRQCLNDTIRGVRRGELAMLSSFMLLCCCCCVLCYEPWLLTLRFGGMLTCDGVGMGGGGGGIAALGCYSANSAPGFVPPA